MSGAKNRMREKKMRNQPSSVYSSSPGPGGSGNKNGGSGNPHYGPSGKQENRGWVRGHQKGGHGYAQEMPPIITASDFARARAAEVRAMLKAVTRTTGSCHAFGALPKHMRRRAMSHNTKRLPCRLREAANRMLEKTQQAGKKAKKEQSKSKSRKARRRHGNLLLEFNRRQRKNVWLETHIWHAKRFHMLKKWGYKLGDRPTCKCYRACYRAMSSHSLLMDMSYYCCVELQGEEEQLLAALSQLTSKETGPTFAAAACLSGRRQGGATAYRAGRYPSEPLGPVTFLWRPRGLDSHHRQLWIWMHPSLKQDLLPELQAVCCCSEPVFQPDPIAALPVPEHGPGPVPGPSTHLAPPPDPGSGSEKKPGEQFKIGAKRKRSSKGETGEPPAKKILGDGTRSPMTPVSWKSSSTTIVINDLTMEMVRYRLIGPQSHSVLTETLEAATECDDLGKYESSPLWWPSHCRNEKDMHLHQQQADVFRVLKGIFSTGEIPSGTVLGLTVDDPRLTLPKKRGKAMPDLREAQGVDEDKRRELTLNGVPEHLCQSFLWDRVVRDNVTENKISEQDLNRMKSELLVPGSVLKPTPPQGRVPLLLVQQPGKQVGQEMPSWGAGWDLILPKGWGMAFWVPLVYRGVRVAGLRMSLKHSQNKGAPHFPHDYPDCPAGVRFQEELERELLDKFKRRPPAKRTNYIKHGCLAPFRCPWQQLSEEWEMIVREGEGGPEGDGRSRPGPVVGPLLPEKEEEEVTRQQGVVGTTRTHFTVLRNRKSLRLLSDWCRPTSSRGQRSTRPRASPLLDRPSAASLLQAHGRAAVWVRLSALSKGQPELHALVCVPTPEDLKLLRSDPTTRGPLEPLHRDHFKSRVRQSRKEQRKMKKKMKKKKKLPSSSVSVFGEKPGGKSTDVSATDTTCSPTPAVTTSPSSTPAVTTTPSSNPAVTTTPSSTPAVTTTPSSTPAVTTTPSSTPAVTTTPSSTPAVTTSPSSTLAVTTSPSSTLAVTTTPSSTPAVTTTPSSTPAVTTTPSSTPAVTTTPSSTPAVTTTPSSTQAVTTSPSSTPAVTTTPSSTPAVTTTPISNQAVTATPSSNQAVTTTPSSTHAVTTTPSAVQGSGQTLVAVSAPTISSIQAQISVSTATHTEPSDPVSTPFLPPTPALPGPTAVEPISAPAQDTQLAPSSFSSSSDLVLGVWPDPLPSVVSHCSRVTLGWVTQGDFSLTAGCGEALGLLSLPGLLHTILGQPADQRGLVLLRNPSSLQYRFAKINIEV